MKAAIGVYDSHDKALEAVKQLQSAGYDSSKLSVIGQATSIDDHLHVISSSQNVERAEISVGAIAGSVIGVLAGVGLFAIPGLGFLYGAGALVGAFAGLDIGIISGGLAAVLTQMGMDKTKAHEYEKHLKEGKFMVVAQGEPDELEHAEKTLGDHGTHLELDVH
jgi:uncharacterized membrane protein